MSATQETEKNKDSEQVEEEEEEEVEEEEEQPAREIDAVSNLFNQMTVKTSVPLIDFILRPGTSLHPSINNLMYIIFAAIIVTAGILYSFGFTSNLVIGGFLFIAVGLFASWQAYVL